MVVADDRPGVAALAAALVADPAYRRRFATAPAAELARHAVADGELARLADLVEAGTRGHPAEERRACQALVFLALASRRG